MPDTIKVFTDGASRGNPGKAAAGIYITDVNGNKIAEHYKYLGEATNNTAEYLALLESIETIKALNITFDCIEYYCDSELVVKQLTGAYKIKHKDMISYSMQFFKKIKELGKEFAISYIPRTQNKEADKLANRALDEQAKEERARILNEEN